MNWTQEQFDFSEPRYFFNAYRGRQRSDMEQARMIGFYASLIHSSGKIRISDFGLFSWESEKAYAPEFSPLDPDAFARLDALEF